MSTALFNLFAISALFRFRSLKIKIQLC